MSLTPQEIDVLNLISLDDPFNLLDGTVEDGKKKKVSVQDNNLKNKAISEINDFIAKNGRVPNEVNDGEEHNLAIHYKRILDDKSMKELIRNYDKYNLLVKKEKKDALSASSKENKNEDIFSDEISSKLLDIDNSDAKDLFDFSNGISTSKERAQADFIAKRKPCRNFNKYKSLFESVQKAIESKHRKLIPFSEKNLHVGGFYVQNGILLYLESMDRLKMRVTKYDGRTHCIYANGTESNILYQSLRKALIADNGQSITEDDRDDAGVLFTHDTIKIGVEDREAGSLYVLMSLSQKEQIKAIPNLYKIGFTTKSVESRISNASKESTYLSSDVRVVATWKCYNTKTQKVEDIIHRFLKSAQVVFTINNDAKISDATEWFSVPLPIIKETVERISDRTIVNYYYNCRTQSIEKK